MKPLRSILPKNTCRLSEKMFMDADSGIHWPGSTLGHK
ncbi:hypothetical protein [Pseudomonas sp. FG-3G]|nr:hypothetical protein [Pseudomonas sp. FG-3G]